MPPVSFYEALRFWFRLGFISFGGPVGQIAIMNSEVVDKRKWLPQGDFLRALNFCMILPGPEAQQLATYIGWRLHGTWGGVAAGSLFVLPSVFLILGLSWLAAARLQVPAVAGAFYGVQPAVVAVVALAVGRIGRRALFHRTLYIFPAAAFTAVFWLGVPFPWVVAAAALGGLILHRLWPSSTCAQGWDQKAHACRMQAQAAGPSSRPPLVRLLRLALLFGAMWGLPILLLAAWRGSRDVLVIEALFFSKAALVTFGGAYAVLSYIADFATSSGWLSGQQMLVGLGLAESTPGPLIMVTQYVGFLGAWNLAAGQDPFLNGVLGAAITTYVTFLPCFFFILAGSPYVEHLAGNPRLQAALGGVTAAVVGVILNLAWRFGRQVFYAGGQADFFALALAGACFLLLLPSKIPLHFLIPLTALAGMIWRLAAMV